MFVFAIDSINLAVFFSRSFSSLLRQNSVSNVLRVGSYLYAQCAPSWRAPSVINYCYSSKGKVFFWTFGLGPSSISQSEFVILTN
jgi:hypothetical protein